MTLLVGLTGGIACGKYTVTAWLLARGVPVGREAVGREGVVPRAPHAAHGPLLRVAGVGRGGEEVVGAREPRTLEALRKLAVILERTAQPAEAQDVRVTLAAREGRSSK